MDKSGAFGKLSPSQIKAFLAIAEKAEGEFAEIREQVIANPAVLEVVGKNLFAWGEYYRLPPNVQSAFVMRQFGLGDLFKQAALQENIPDALLDLAGMEIPDEWVETKELQEAVQQRLSFALGMYFSLQSVFYYGKWMHELLEAGDDRSLLQAISVQPNQRRAITPGRFLYAHLWGPDNAFLRSIATLDSAAHTLVP